jgi:hypothetical protein
MTHAVDHLDIARAEAIDEIVSDLTNRLGVGLQRHGLNDPQLRAIGAVALAGVVRAYCRATGEIGMVESMCSLIKARD